MESLQMLYIFGATIAGVLIGFGLGVFAGLSDDLPFFEDHCPICQARDDRRRQFVALAGTRKG